MMTVAKVLILKILNMALSFQSSIYQCVRFPSLGGGEKRGDGDWGDW